MTDKPDPASTPKAQVAESARQVAYQARKVGESAQHLEAQAGAVVESTDLQLVSAERRTVLAASRTALAEERTYAAWVRTGMAALAGGAAVRPLLEDRWSAWIVLFTASTLLIFSVFCFFAGVWRRLQHDDAPPRPGVRRIPAALLILANAALSLAALVALAEIWLAEG